MRAVCYLRFSCIEQADGFSLDAQRHSTHACIQQRGWTLVREYVDAGHSAKANAHRPGFEQMMADAALGLFDVVVVDKVDRFYRHLKGLLTALDELNSYGVTVTSVKENLDFTSPWGKIALSILGILAEVYIDNLRQETKKGKVARARKGLWNGKIPFGYCKGLCSKCTDPNGPNYCPNFGQLDLGNGKMLVSHPIESIAVKLAFEWYAAGNLSDTDVAIRLNTAKFTLPDGTQVPFRTKGKIGGLPATISRDAVRALLTRPFYIGLVPYGGVDEEGKRRRRKEVRDWHPGQQPTLVGNEIFDRVQELRLNARRRYCATDETHPIAAHPLSGILVCASCGRPQLRGIVTIATPAALIVSATATNPLFALRPSKLR